MADEIKEPIEIDFGNAEEPAVEPETEVKETPPPVETKKETPPPAKKELTEEQIEEMIAKRLAAKEEPPAEPEEEPDYIEGLLNSKEFDLDKEFPRILMELHKSRQETKQAVAELKAMSKQHGEFASKFGEQERMGKLKAEAGDLSVEELKSEAAKRTNELLGYDDDYKPQNDDEGRAWISAANRLYKKVLEERKSASKPTSNTRPVSKTSAPSSDGKSAALKRLEAEGIDFSTL